MVRVDIEKLKYLKYTESGIKRYEKTMLDYSNRLLDQSRLCAKARRVSGDEIEITSEHVRRAVEIISSDFGITSPKWKIWCQVVEYLFSVLSGLLGPKALSGEDLYYLASFIGALGVVVILFVIRHMSK